MGHIKETCCPRRHTPLESKQVASHPSAGNLGVNKVDIRHNVTTVARIVCLIYELFSSVRAMEVSSTFTYRVAYKRPA